MTRVFINRLLSILAGVTLLISGAGKALDSSAFALLIKEYGFQDLMALAPVIIIFEIILGLNLFFLVWQRYSAFAAIVLVLIFSSFYLYAFLENGVKDCGCFGDLDMLRFTPATVFVRNLLLIAGLSYVFIKSKNNSPSSRTVNYIYSLYALSIFTPALTFDLDVLKSSGFHEPKIKELSIPFHQSALSERLPVDPDSSCFVFIFSYDCPHCISSLKKLEEYHNLAPCIIGLTRRDSVAKASFIRETGTNLRIVGVAPEVLSKITRVVPMTYYIHNDSVRLMIKGELPGFEDLRNRIELF